MGVDEAPQHLARDVVPPPELVDKALASRVQEDAAHPPEPFRRKELHAKRPERLWSVAQLRPIRSEHCSQISSACSSRRCTIHFAVEVVSWQGLLQSRRDMFPPVRNK